MKEKNMGKLLVEELLAIGITDSEPDEHGYVYASPAAISAV
jgi:tripeptide aminopeptidase